MVDADSLLSTFLIFPSLNAIVWLYNSDWRIDVHGVVESEATEHDDDL